MQRSGWWTEVVCWRNTQPADARGREGRGGGVEGKEETERGSEGDKKLQAGIHVR